MTLDNVKAVLAAEHVPRWVLAILITIFSALLSGLTWYTVAEMRRLDDWKAEHVSRPHTDVLRRIETLESDMQTQGREIERCKALLEDR